MNPAQMNMPSAITFAPFTALSFDCYGTLIDWETGIADELELWARRHHLHAGREELLAAFAAIETGVQQDTPTMLYPDVLATTMRRLDDQFDVTSSPEQVESFAGSVPRWPAFADSPAALQQLHERFTLIILSNIDRDSFTASERVLGVHFDLVVTAQDVGAYKPSAASFPALLDAAARIGVEKAHLLHVAQSLYHDHVPAKEIGLPTVWIDRRQDRAGYGATPPPPTAVVPDWTFTSMAGFAAAATA